MPHPAPSGVAQRLRLPLALLLAVVAGAALAASFQPYDLVWLLPFGVALVTWLCRGVRLRRGFLIGVATGCAFMVGLLPWVRVVGIDAWLGLGIAEGLFYGLVGFGTAAVTRLPWWPLWVGGVWVAVELLRGTVPFGGFTWGRLGYAVPGTPVAPLVAVVGPAGATYVLVLVGASLAWAAPRLRRTPVRGVTAVVVACVVAGSGLAWPWAQWAREHRGDRIWVAAVQGNVPGEGLDAFSERRVVLENHVSATQALATEVAHGEAPQPDLVIWPESSTDIDPFASRSAYAQIQGAVSAIDAPTLVGATSRGPDGGRAQNVGIVWDPESGPGEIYAKQHLVPFGEYIPMRSLLLPHISRLRQVGQDLKPGTEPGVLNVGPATVGDLICFEVAYDGLVRAVVTGGAQMLVVQTNNATYMGTGQVEQQFAMARVRAIQTGRYVVVAATNGISGIIAPDGEVVERAPTRVQTVLLRPIHLLHGLTPAMRWGPWIKGFLVVLGAAAVAAGIVAGYGRRTGAARPRRRGPEATTPTAGDAVGSGNGRRTDTQALSSYQRPPVPDDADPADPRTTQDQSGRNADRGAASDRDGDPDLQRGGQPRSPG